MENNQHVEYFLKYYTELKIKPEFAVLIRGVWGSGKTWFIQQFLQENSVDHLYISLNGVSKTKEIEDSIFQQLHPILSSKGMKVASKILKGIIKTTIHVDFDGDGKNDASASPSIPDVEIESYFKNVDERVIIFDDLERCSIEIKDILGYINQYVEVNGLKVIILANEKEILNSNDKKTYKKIKEKVIGKSFDIETDYQSAVTAFIDQLTNEKVKEYLNETPIIEETYLTASYQNLRHLRQSLLDFERFIEYIPDDCWEKDGLIDHLLRLFLTISFEIKKGKIIEDNIIELLLSIPIPYNKTKDEKPKPIDEIRSKHSVFKLRYQPISSELLKEYFSSGAMNADRVNNSIKSSYYYQDDNTPDWIKLLRFRTLSDDEFEALSSKIYENILSKNIEDRYEILQMSGLFLYLEELTLFDMDRQVFVEKVKECIDEMRTKDLFKLQGGERYPSDHSHGLMYSCFRTDEFQSILSHVKDIIEDQVAIDLPDKAAALCNSLRESVDDFGEKIILSNSRNNLYYETPIFQFVNTEELIGIIIGLSNHDKQSFAYYIQERYERGHFKDRLLPDLDNLRLIKFGLVEKLSELGKISAHIIDKEVISSLDLAITKLEEGLPDENENAPLEID